MKREDLIELFKKEGNYYLNFDHRCVDESCDAYECEHDDLWDTEEEELKLFFKEDIVNFINSGEDDSFFDEYEFSPTKTFEWGTRNKYINYRVENL